MIHDFIHTALHVLLWAAGISFSIGGLIGFAVGRLSKRRRA